MLRGQYNHIIDDKGRITMPAKLRDTISHKFNNSLVLTQHEGYLMLFPYEEWRILEEKISHQSFLKKEVRAFQRSFMSVAIDCSLDSLGRILIPLQFRDYAGIKKDTVVVGMIRQLEIWSKERFDEEMKRAESKIGEYGEYLLQLGI